MASSSTQAPHVRTAHTTDPGWCFAGCISKPPSSKPGIRACWMVRQARHCWVSIMHADPVGLDKRHRTSGTGHTLSLHVCPLLGHATGVGCCGSIRSSLREYHDAGAKLCTCPR